MRTENAQLQVDLRHLQLQLNVLEADNVELQKQNAGLDADYAKLSRSYEQIQRLNADLGSDHELLQVRSRDFGCWGRDTIHTTPTRPFYRTGTLTRASVDHNCG